MTYKMMVRVIRRLPSDYTNKDKKTLLKIIKEIEWDIIREDAESNDTAYQDSLSVLHEMSHPTWGEDVKFTD